MKTQITTFCLLLLLPALSLAQIVRQEADKTEKNKTIVYKIEGSSDLDILNQLDEDVDVGQVIQIAWERPHQKPRAETNANPPKTIEKSTTPPTPPTKLENKAPALIAPPPPKQVEKIDRPAVTSTALRNTSNIKKRKKKIVLFRKRYKNKKSKRSNLRKCYVF